jgi:hypothetical protein
VPTDEGSLERIRQSLDCIEAEQERQIALLDQIEAALGVTREALGLPPRVQRPKLSLVKGGDDA